MTDGTFLDVVLVAIICLVGLISFWRGAIRSLVELAGIMVGGELGLWWSDNLSEQLQNLFDIEATRAGFMASLLLLAVGAIAIGVVGSNLLVQRPPARPYQIVGFFIGIGNGLLLLSFALRFYVLYLPADAARVLEEARVAQFMWEDYDLLLLGVVVVDVGLMVLWWVLGPITGREPTVVATEVARTSESAVTGAALRSSDRVDDSLYAPDRGTEAATNATASRVPDGSHAGFREESQLDPAAASVVDEIEYQSVEDNNPPEEPAAPFDRQHAEPQPLGEPLLSFRITACDICGHEVSEDDQYCPECGNAVIRPVQT